MMNFLKSVFYAMLPPLLKDMRYMRSISHNSKIGRFVKLNRPCRVSNLEIGDYSYIGPYSHVSNVTIGKFCSIGPGFFAGWGIHPVDGLSTAPMFYSVARQNGLTLVEESKIDERKRIVIGNDVFIGVNVTILDGVKIGDGAVVAAGAVVVSDVAPYSIVGGVPAKEIRKRFIDEVIVKLLEIKWWDFPDYKLRQVERYFYDVDGFLKEWEESKARGRAEETEA